MNKDELKSALKEAANEYELKKSEIYGMYAFSNNPYKIGDIISDNVGTIKIEKIKFNVSFGESECVYIGTQYNKNGEVSKKQDHNTIYQSNIITKP